MQETHEFDDRDGGVGVVELDGDFLWKGLPIGIALVEAADDVAQRAGDKEILLHESEFLSDLGFIIRIKNLADRFGHVFLMNGLLVSAAVEGFKIKFLGGAGFPQAEEVDGFRAEAGNRDVVGNAENLATADPLWAGVARVVTDIFDMAVNRYFGGVLGADDFPRSAIDHPSVWVFDLMAVAEFLFEESVLIVDAVADSGKVERGERVKEASGETAKTTVAEAHIVFLFAELFDVVA